MCEQKKCDYLLYCKPIMNNHIVYFKQNLLNELHYLQVWLQCDEQ